jgi:leader peptidase (prepilin peptidase)/N-methyltransferase
MRLGVPLIPDRAAVRSTTTDPSTRAFGTVSAWPSPLVLGGAALAVITVAVAAATATIPLAGALGIALLVPAAAIDVRQRRLPDAWVAAGAIAVVTTLVVESVIGGPADAGSFATVALGAAAMAVPVLVLHLTSPASMGFGDVKAAAVLGAAIGTVDARLAAVALCLAAASGATVGLATRRHTIAFGPFLLIASLLVLLGHDPIADAIFAEGTPR